MFHKPVLLDECINGLAINKNGIYVDATYGGGGHTAEILKRLDKGKVFAFEQDDDALLNKINDDRLMLFNNNFRYIKNLLNYNGIYAIDGLIADLGVSSYQFDTGERGFSIRFNTTLDMRMHKKQKLSAKEILNEYSAEDLTAILKNFGELNDANLIANDIINFRYNKSIETTNDLIEAVKTRIPKHNENKFLSKAFQALRIEVNEELEALKEMLLQSIDLVKKHGRLVIISYHSLEDRIAKNFIKTGNFEGVLNKDFFGNPLVSFRQINKNIICPSEQEIIENNRARSAKMRIAERI